VFEDLVTCFHAGPVLNIIREVVLGPKRVHIIRIWIWEHLGTGLSARDSGGQRPTEHTCPSLLA
jgi:hypothetical protein